jgi:uncharacterized protein YecT (DUF1311 family)
MDRSLLNERNAALARACRNLRAASLLASLVVGAAFFCANPAQAAPAASPPDWVLSYEGKSSNSFIWDKRSQALVRTRVPAKLSDRLLSALGGPPDPVFVLARRYVSVSACRPHSCDEKGFFWIDSKTGTGLGAYFTPDSLLLGSNGMSSDGLPGPARQALANWLKENDLRPKVVEFVGQGGNVTTLEAALFSPPPAFQPPAGGPSFDCAKAATPSEKAICADARLAKLDLDLAQLVTGLRHGHDTVGARNQLLDLQRSWLKGRDAQCRRAADISACLKEQYRAQHDRLMNWIPTS